jgi:hypothetical protein
MRAETVHGYASPRAILRTWFHDAAPAVHARSVVEKNPMTEASFSVSRDTTSRPMCQAGSWLRLHLHWRGENFDGFLPRHFHTISAGRASSHPRRMVPVGWAPPTNEKQSKPWGTRCPGTVPTIWIYKWPCVVCGVRMDLIGRVAGDGWRAMGDGHR